MGKVRKLLNEFHSETNSSRERSMQAVRIPQENRRSRLRLVWDSDYLQSAHFSLWSEKPLDIIRMQMFSAGPPSL